MVTISRVGPGFFLGGGISLRNGITDWWHTQILKANNKKALSHWGGTPCTLLLDLGLTWQYNPPPPHHYSKNSSLVLNFLTKCFLLRTPLRISGCVWINFWNHTFWHWCKTRTERNLKCPTLFQLSNIIRLKKSPGMHYEYSVTIY